MLGQAVERARSPGAVAVAAEIHRVHMEILTQNPRYPIPVARVIQAAVNQHQRRLSILPPVPEMEL